MKLFLVVIPVIALCLVLNNQSTQSSWESRAVANTQRTLASKLDAELPRLSFAEWFEKVVGPGAGVVWQLSECGDRGEDSLNATGDIRACVEANAMLLDGRRVILMTAVGTFKKGITGPPSFQFGVIERNGVLKPIRRLRDLQGLLLNPEKLPERPAVRLPEINEPGASLAANNAYPAVTPTWGAEDSGRLAPIEDPEPPAPPRPKAPVGENPEMMPEGLRILGSVTWGGVIKKAQPRYPPGAKRYNISGAVDVQVTLSAVGVVTEAKAVSGHPLLRGAAEEAARQWVFKPATLKGVPVETQVVLTFLFKVPQ